MATFAKGVSAGDCVNLTVSGYDFFLVFSLLPPRFSLLEFRSFLRASELSLARRYTEADIKSHIHVPVPFAFFRLEVLDGPGSLSFSYGSLPGICASGIWINNYKNIDLDLGASLSEPYDLSPGADKCVLFTAPGLQNFSIDLTCFGKFYVYHNFTSSQLFFGKQKIEVSLRGDDRPGILRYVAHSSAHPEALSVRMLSDSPDPSSEFLSFHRPLARTYQTCAPTAPCGLLMLDWSTIGIYSAFCVSALMVVSAAVYVVLMWRCPWCVQYTPATRRAMELAPSDAPAVADRGHPQGYFALDPLRRPSEA
jgi:hypothetical protein